MTTIEINRKFLDENIGKKPLDSDLREKISMFGTPVEEITKNEIKIDVTPNRPDLLSDQGFVRSFACYLGIKKGLRKYDVLDSKEKVTVEGDVAIVRPHIVCAIVKGIKFNDEKIKEVIKIQEKLHITYGRNRKRCAIGIYPLNKINFPVKYTARKPLDIRFMPLESNKIMNGAQILEMHPTGREYKALLENYSVYPLLVDSKDKVLSMPPIINSNDVGKIEVGTGDVFVECTGFDVDVLKKCLNMVVCSLSDMGGKIYSVSVEHRNKTVKTPDLNPEEMKIDTNYVNKRLGIELNEKEICLLLEKMGFAYQNKKVLIPAYRTDVLHMIDLVEDIAIAYGYTNFKEEIPMVATIAKEDEFEMFKSKIANILVGMGLDEINSTNIMYDKIQTQKMLVDFKPIMLFNSFSSDFNSLRNFVIPSLLAALKQNKNSEYSQNVFEIGRIFKWDKNNKTETGIIENDRVAVALCYKYAGFTEVRQKLGRLLNLLGVDYEIKQAAHPSFIPGRVARISVNNTDVAYVGEINPQVISNFDLDMPVAAFELNLTELFEEIKK